MACLTRAEVEHFAAGQALPAAARSHVDGCASCRAALAASSAASTEASAQTPFDAEPDAVPLEEPGRYVRQADGVEVLLGVGGYARVLLARDRVIGRDVALKTLRQKHLSSPRRALTEKRLLQEARVVGQLEHPSIVPLYDLARTDEGDLFYAMRRIRGRTLADAIAAAPTLDARLRLLPHVLAACHAVAYAHSRGVLHRDLKPHNVMVDRFGETLVIDWGLASARHDEEEDDERSSAGIRLVSGAETVSDGHGRLGTPAYMSPEQFSGVRALLDARSDVFGLGAILFEVLTGEAPREKTALDAAPPKVLSVAPAVPADLAALCDKALEASPDARYQTAEALALDLDAWLHGRLVTAHAYRPFELMRRVVRQHRVAFAVGAASLVALTAVSIAALVGVRNERNEARQLALLLSEDLVDRLHFTSDDPAQKQLLTTMGHWLRGSGQAGDRGRAALAWARLLPRSELAPADRTEAARTCLEMLEGAPGDDLGRAAELRCSNWLDGKVPRTLEERRAALLATWKRTEVPTSTTHALLAARGDLALDLANACNNLSDSEGTIEWSRTAARIGQELTEREPTRAAHWSLLAAADSMLALAYLNAQDGVQSLAAAEGAVHAAKEGHQRAHTVNSAYRVADAWAGLRMVQRFFPELTSATARAEAASTALRQLEALVEFDDQNMTVVQRLAEFYFDEGLHERGWALVSRRTDFIYDRTLVLWSAVLAGHPARALEFAAGIEPGMRTFDVWVTEGLAHLQLGDDARAAAAFEDAARQDFLSLWAVEALPRWAEQQKGPHADELRRFVAEVTAAQRTNDEARAHRALTEFATALR